MKTILHTCRTTFALVCLQAAIVLLPPILAHGAGHRFAQDVAQLAAAPAPASGGILMVGSSIFRKWTTCTNDLAPLPVVNRAFGGSETPDQLFFFDQIVPSSHAAVVVWYCGSNDVNDKATPAAILHNTAEWIQQTQTALPQVRIVLVSVIRAPQKRGAGFLAQVDEVNRGLAKLAGSIPNVTYADVNPSLETPLGEPLIECYVPDKLHLTPKGYRRMTTVLRPVIEMEWKESPTARLPKH